MGIPSVSRVRLLSLFLLVALIVLVVQAVPRKKEKLATNSVEGNGKFDLLWKIIRDKEISKPEYLKSSSVEIKRKGPVDAKIKPKNLRKTSNERLRSDLLRQELAKESQGNCLTKLLCGSNGNRPPGTGQPAGQSGQNSGVLSDYSLLVKEFLDIFSDDESEKKAKETLKNEKNKAVTEKKKSKPETNDDDDAENDDDEDDEDDNARSGQNFVNITASLGGPDPASPEVTTSTSTSTTVTSITTGATITELNQLVSSTPVQKVTLEELIGDVDVDRQGRSLKSKKKLKLTFGKPKLSKYVNTKMRQMNFATTETDKLRIARQIVVKLREPRQCREFSNNIASEVLSTCPLTTEVIRYFNTNLKNSAQLALLRPSLNSTEPGGLVLLNDKGGVPHPYFLDNSPLVANTNINNDLKNPSVGDRFPIEQVGYNVYESIFPQKFDTSKVKLTVEEKKKKEKKQAVKADEEDSDENDDEDEEEDEEEGEDEADLSGEEEAGEDKFRKLIGKQNGPSASPYKLRSQLKKPAKKPENDKKEFKSNRKPSLPPGIIKVYGVPQPSFDKEFFQISNQVGLKKVVLFDHDDEDAWLPNPPGTPTRKQLNKQEKRARRKKKKQEAQRPKSNIPTSESNSEEDEEDEGESREMRRERPPFSYATTPYYNSFPAPRPEEYYQKGKPLRPKPPTPYEMPMNYRRPRPEVRARLNFYRDSSAGLMRPQPRPYGRWAGPPHF